MKSARDEFRKVVAETLTDWRLRCIPPRPDSSFERAIFIAGLAEVLRLRLQIAYMPLLQGLQRIEDRVNILATMREDPYAPPPAPKQIAPRLGRARGHCYATCFAVSWDITSSQESP